jgi:hypothetical protein
MKDNSSVNSLTCEDQDKAWARGIVTLGVFDALAALLYIENSRKREIN